MLAPTRELAVQVAEAMTDFSKHMRGVNVVALYGGQRYDVQLRALRQGPQIVVGTPGRLLDHLKRGTLDLSKLSGLVLDEADEMLRMGFIEDVETIMAQIPEGHQTALFSATMPEAIRRITRRFMKEPQEVRIQSSVTTRPDISQSYWTVWGMRKNEALVRFLEAEDFDAAIIFVRTKNATLEVAEALERNGYNSAALNGDMNQALREQTLERLKDGRLDILIATDVAARGLDVERISLVVNYDIPMDSESYVHRIGRTGRAGRAGRALLFVENRERRLLRNIERTMKLTIPEVELPNAELLGKRRLEKFAAKVQQQLESSDLDQYRALLSKIQPTAEGEELDLETLAAALLKMAQGERTLIVPPDAPMRRNVNSVTVMTVVRAIVTTVARVATVKIVRVANVVMLAICSCTVLKWAAMMVLKFVISLVRLLTKATSAAVTSVTSSCLLLTPPSNCRKVCRVKCCNTLRVLAFSTSR